MRFGRFMTVPKRTANGLLVGFFSAGFVEARSAQDVTALESLGLDERVQRFVVSVWTVQNVYHLRLSGGHPRILSFARVYRSMSSEQSFVLCLSVPVCVSVQSAW